MFLFVQEIKYFLLTKIPECGFTKSATEIKKKQKTKKQITFRG